MQFDIGLSTFVDFQRLSLSWIVWLIWYIPVAYKHLLSQLRLPKFVWGKSQGHRKPGEGVWMLAVTTSQAFVWILKQRSDGGFKGLVLTNTFFFLDKNIRCHYSLVSLSSTKCFLFGKCWFLFIHFNFRINILIFIC